jgi:hypothetical protein
MAFAPSLVQMVVFPFYAQVLLLLLLLLMMMIACWCLVT